MGITVASLRQYENAIKKLFPQGEYWDRQFADPESDVSLFVKAKLQELLRYRGRMSTLHDESRIETSAELLENWERVLLDTLNYRLDTEQRRDILLATNTGSSNMETIKKTGRIFGITVTNVTLPYRPAFFGHSRLGVDPIASPAAFSVVFVYALPTDDAARREFERQVSVTTLANHIAHFFYGGV